MGLDYSSFSISNALGTQMVPQQRSATTTIAPQECSFAEQEPCLLRDQAWAKQIQHDVDITSYSMHSFNTSPQHQPFIYPSHSFSHTPEDYVLPRSDFVHNTSSARGYHENYFQGVSPLFARVTVPQRAQPDLTYPSARILALEGQSAQDQPSEAIDSPLFCLDSFDGACSSLNYQHHVSHSRPPTNHVPSVPFPAANPVSFPGFYPFAMQENMAGTYPSFYLNSQEGQQLDVTRGSSTGLSQPPRFYSADPPRTGCLGKRLRRTSSDSDLAELDVTTKDLRSTSNSFVKRAVPASYAARSSHLGAHRAKANHLVEIPHAAPRKVRCDGRMVDECAVQNAIEGEQPLLHVYECKWNKGHSPCRMYIEGDQSSVTDHLLRFHNFTGGEGDTACLWNGCLSKKRAAMKGTSIARHLVTHIEYKVQCTTCNVVFAREDACRRSHGNARSDCRSMHISPVHGGGVIALKVQNCGPVAKKRRLADS